MNNRIKDRTGEINYNFYGSKMTIIKYNNWENVIIEFENGYKTTNSYSNFEKGVVKNPYDKSIFGVGYFGEGKFNSSVNNKHSKVYIVWHSMLERGYSDKLKEKRPTYENVTVS